MVFACQEKAAIRMGSFLTRLFFSSDLICHYLKKHQSLTLSTLNICFIPIRIFIFEFTSFLYQLRFILFILRKFFFFFFLICNALNSFKNLELFFLCMDLRNINQHPINLLLCLSLMDIFHFFRQEWKWKTYLQILLMVKNYLNC